MTNAPAPDDDVDHAERLAADADVLKNAWQGTLDEMQEMAAELEEDGWEAYEVPALDTAPEPPDSGEEGRWGLVHVIPDNHAGWFASRAQEGEFPEYDVFRREVEGRVFHVTALYDPETSTALLIAGVYELMHAHGLVSKAQDAGKMYTHVTTLDGTERGVFEHEEPAKFFPAFERFTDEYDMAV